MCGEMVTKPTGAVYLYLLGYMHVRLGHLPKINARGTEQVRHRVEALGRRVALDWVPPHGAPRLLNKGQDFAYCRLHYNQLRTEHVLVLKLGWFFLRKGGCEMDPQ